MPASNASYGRCCGVCPCALVPGLVFFFAATFASGFLFLAGVPLASYMSAPVWTSAAVSAAFAVFGLVALHVGTRDSLHLCRLVYKVYLVLIFLLDLLILVLQIVLIVRLKQSDRDVLNERSFIFDAYLPSDISSVKRVIGVSLTIFVALRSLYYLFAYAILGTLKSLGEVLHAGGDGSEKLNADALLRRRGEIVV
ncbi:MAG: uncharacterized protein KVP18_000192 [Porospora cf. gigantea A]|uniref:uncharacterized protein n=1 Tax=Porospora cf. gigantea A TaxID=2853593 RepID=UPI00355A89F3|nr:MAG: hypothetical protein KVP18_000192 [Porospora cf. gigantea A]